LGYASALAIVLFVIILALYLIQRRITEEPAAGR
jgi:ABC-type sugar transport system permease subunit